MYVVVREFLTVDIGRRLVQEDGHAFEARIGSVELLPDTRSSRAFGCLPDLQQSTAGHQG
jgi:hypothetical protein